MKRWITWVGLMVALAVTAKGQSSETKAYLQQIAAYEVYLKDAEKGYEVVESGVHTVGQIKNGTFGLHSAFFSSLKAIDPAVKSYAEIAEVVLLQISIVESFQQTLKSLKQSGQLNAGELAYVGQVYNTVVNDALQDVEALTTLVTAGSYSMNDGDRLRQIDGLYNDMADKYTFTQSFIGQCQSLDRSRAMDVNDMNEVGGLYGLK